MKCYSCGKLKHELHPHGSKLLNGVTLLMCQTCIDDGMEPRYIIIMAGRQFGPDSVKDFVTKRKYHGNTITFEEIFS